MANSVANIFVGREGVQCGLLLLENVNSPRERLSYKRVSRTLAGTVGAIDEFE